jgi:hypothetical protein
MKAEIAQKGKPPVPQKKPSGYDTDDSKLNDSLNTPDSG